MDKVRVDQLPLYKNAEEPSIFTFREAEGRKFQESNSSIHVILESVSLRGVNECGGVGRSSCFGCLPSLQGLENSGDSIVPRGRGRVEPKCSWCLTLCGHDALMRSPSSPRGRRLASKSGMATPGVCLNYLKSFTLLV